MNSYNQIENLPESPKPGIGRKRIMLASAAVAVFSLVAWSTGQEVPATQPGAAAPAPTTLVADGVGSNGALKLTVNKSSVVKTTNPYKRLSIGNPEIADVNGIGPSTILVTAKKVGSTQLIIWDDNDRSQVVDVVVNFDLAALNEHFKSMFPNSKIEASDMNGTIALRGRAPTLEIAAQAVAVATPYGKTANFLDISGGQQVMLQVRFAEVSKSATNALGVNFAVGDGVATFGNNIGSPLTFQPTTPLGSISRSLPGTATQFGSGQLGMTSFEVFVTALRNNNLLRVLAEPNLVANSGQEASFLAGGEFPIPVPQSGGGGNTTITIEYKQFGVKLKFVPVILGDGRVRMKCNPEVSDLDFSNAVNISGFRVPALTTRTVNTTVELAEGQTLALAGLLNTRSQANSDVTPLLGDLPVIGALFRSVRYERKETELVVFVTPRLVEAMNPKQVPQLPGEKWRHPSEAELFWNRDLGGPAAMGPGSATTQPTNDGTPSKFRGAYGFTAPEQPQSADARD